MPDRSKQRHGSDRSHTIVDAEFFEAAPDLFCVLDLQGRLLRVNHSFAAALGYRGPEVVDHLFDELVHPDDLPRSRADFERRVGGGPLLPFANRIRASDGSYHVMTWTGTIDHDHGLVYACARDLTGVAHSGGGVSPVAAIETVNPETGPFFTLALDMLCITGPNGYFLRVNPAFEKGMGYTAGELVSRPFTEFLHPDDLERTQQEYAAQLGGKDVLRFENRYRHKDGSYRWLSWTGAPTTDGRIYAVARDITQLKEEQDGLRQSRDALDTLVRKRTHALELALQTLRGERERYANLVDSSPFAICVHRDDRPLFVNAAFARVFGYESPAEVMALGDLSRLFTSEDQRRILEYRASLERGDPHPRVFEVAALRKDRKPVWLEQTSWIVEWDGTPAFQATYIDITEKRSLQEQLAHSQRLEGVGQLAGGSRTTSTTCSR